MRGVTDAIFYLASSFWLGAVHAATSGHGKTISTAYIVGARGRPVDAVVLGIFVTLSHTNGIILVALLATLGSAWLLPQRVEAYLGVGAGLLVIGIGLWMLRAQLSLAASERAGAHAHDDAQAHSAAEHTHDHVHAHDHGIPTEKTCSTGDKRTPRAFSQRPSAIRPRMALSCSRASARPTSSSAACRCGARWTRSSRSPAGRTRSSSGAPAVIIGP